MRHLFVVDSLDKHIQNEKELIRPRRILPAARATRARSAQFYVVLICHDSTGVGGLFCICVDLVDRRSEVPIRCLCPLLSPCWCDLGKELAFRYTTRPVTGLGYSNFYFARHNPPSERRDWRRVSSCPEHILEFLSDLHSTRHDA